MMKKCEWKDGGFEACDGMTNVSYGQDPTSWDFCPYCGADIRKPVTIKAGMFGKFWTPGSYYYQYGEIAEITYEGYSPKGSGTIFPNFTPGLPAGFNQDGMPK